MTNTNTETATATTLEIEICGRCGGGGRYSYNQIDGDRCYGCGGSGKRYTKRGKTAAAYLTALRSKRAADVVIGDKILDEGGMFTVSQWVEITEIAPDFSCSKIVDGVRVATPMVSLVGVGLKTKTRVGAVHMPDRMIRIAQTAEQKAATFAQALAYQATLTKSGTVKKSKGGAK